MVEEICGGDSCAAEKVIKAGLSLVGSNWFKVLPEGGVYFAISVLIVEKKKEAVNAERCGSQEAEREKKYSMERMKDTT